MDEEQLPAGIPGPIQPPPRPPAPAPGKVKRVVGPVAALAVLLAKFKGLFLLGLNYFPTLASMVISIWAYAMFWRWPFAVGFVGLIFVHECGHLLVARRLGLKVGAPMFVPFIGALIALKQMPRNAWHEALVGIGGPLLGSLGAAVCYVIYLATGNGLFGALAYTGFFINLFNLSPIGFLDGGRIVTALSPWLWLVGTVIIGLMMFYHFNLLLLIIFVMSLPRLFSLFRRRSTEEARYFEVTPRQRAIMAGMYFGLIVALVVGMVEARVQIQNGGDRRGETISYNSTAAAPYLACASDAFLRRAGLAGFTGAGKIAGVATSGER